MVTGGNFVWPGVTVKWDSMMILFFMQAHLLTPKFRVGALKKYKSVWYGLTSGWRVVT